MRSYGASRLRLNRVHREGADPQSEYAKDGDRV
jgi:hypothetical protein